MITGVAISGVKHIYMLPEPFRHHHVIEVMSKNPREPMPVTGEQGFMTNEHEFLDRKAALTHAIECGQIETGRWPPNLFSEDLW